ncbi:unnamed protein product, partial [Meganyctiphanes norvegica]
GSIMFHVRRRPADHGPRKRKKKPIKVGEEHQRSRDPHFLPDKLPFLVEIGPDGSELGGSGRQHQLHLNVTEVGTDHSTHTGGQNLQLYGPNLQPRHCVIAHHGRHPQSRPVLGMQKHMSMARGYTKLQFYSTVAWCGLAVFTTFASLILNKMTECAHITYWTVGLCAGIILLILHLVSTLGAATMSGTPQLLNLLVIPYFRLYWSSERRAKMLFYTLS